MCTVPLLKGPKNQPQNNSFIFIVGWASGRLKKNQSPDVERYESVQVACCEWSETKNIGGFPPARNFVDFFTAFWWIFGGIIFFGGRTSYMYVHSRFPDG